MSDFDEGLRNRRAVLGDAHVEPSLARRTEFTREFQDLITRYAWGEIWGRPGLDRKTRSLLTLAFLIALNRPDEFKLHVRATHQTGVSPDELKELILQAAIYCGVPAANSAFHWAEEVLAERDGGG